MCNHPHYKAIKGQYMVADEALKAMALKSNDICWMSETVKTCCDCGEDLSQYRIVRVKTAGEYLREMGV